MYRCISVAIYQCIHLRRDGVGVAELLRGGGVLVGALLEALARDVVGETVIR